LLPDELVSDALAAELANEVLEPADEVFELADESLALVQPSTLRYIQDEL
jgi:hypothetical protein